MILCEKNKKKPWLEVFSETRELIAKIESFYDPEKESSSEEYKYKRELALLVATLVHHLRYQLKDYLYRPPIESWMEGDSMKYLEGRAIPQGLIYDGYVSHPAHANQ